jgi:Zn finger protein HypA/HybF involved in hydrogenase expression
MKKFKHCEKCGHIWTNEDEEYRMKNCPFCDGNIEPGEGYILGFSEPIENVLDPQKR